MAEVRLVDLEVIRRFSLAVRQDAAPADELLAALDASRATVLAALDAAAPAARPAGRAGKGDRSRAAKQAAPRRRRTGEPG